MTECHTKSMSFLDVAKATMKEWSDDHASRLAAAVAYYATFSIAPLLIIAVAMLGLIYGSDAASDRLRPQLVSMIGEKGAEFVQDLAAKAGGSPSLSFAGILSILLIIYAATNLFVALQDALNTIFGVEPKPNRGIRGIIADRALSFLMVFLLGALVLASVVLTTFVASLTKSMPNAISGITLDLVNILGSVLLFGAVFAALFKILPDVKIDWKDTLFGAFLTSVVFTIAKVGLSFYLGRSSTAGPFGAAGSMVVVLLFIYYSTQILFLGAEFTQVWACRNGKPVRPAENAVAVRQADDPVSETTAMNAHSQRTSDRSRGPVLAHDFSLSPHYPSAQFHPPINACRNPTPTIGMASLAALVVLPLTWLAFRKRSH